LKAGLTRPSLFMKMGKISSVKLVPGKGRLRVWVDGELALEVAVALAGRFHLVVGLDVSIERLDEIASLDHLEGGLSLALQFLGYRPRSEGEVRDRLEKRGFGDVVDAVVAKLKAQKLLDDTAFARLWRNDREYFRPKGARLLKQELRQKGVSEEVVNSTLRDVDEEANALEAGRKKARLLRGSEKAEFARRLSDYLKRRGFDYEVIRRVVNSLWEESNPSP
jgi:regulatory protein